MNKDFVVNLELSKKLKEIGYKQESEFWWIGNSITEHYILEYAEEGLSNGNGISAPLTDELLRVLPVGTIVNNDKEKIWHIRCCGGIITEDKSLPNALAKMIIYLEENKIIKLGESQ